MRRAAVTLVAERGLAAVTVDEIAAAANVAPRTFFNYFSSKEDAASGFDPALLAEMVARLRARPTGEPPAASLRAPLPEALTPPAGGHRELLERLRLVRSDPHLLAHHVSAWAETERQLVVTLAGRRGTDPERDRCVSLVVATTLTATRVALLSWCDKKGRVPLAKELPFHLDVLGAGLAEPEWAGRMAIMKMTASRSCIPPGSRWRVRHRQLHGHPHRLLRYVVQFAEVTANTKRWARGLILPPKLDAGSIPEDVLVPKTAAELDGLAITLKEASVDAGFHPPATDEALPGVMTHIVGSSDNAGSRRTRRRLARYRVGAEGRVSHLKRSYGAGRPRLKGKTGAQIWEAWSALAYNLDTVVILKRRAAEMKRSLEEAATTATTTT